MSITIAPISFSQNISKWCKDQDIKIVIMFDNRFLREIWKVTDILDLVVKLRKALRFLRLKHGYTFGPKSNYNLK